MSKTTHTPKESQALSPRSTQVKKNEVLRALKVTRFIVSRACEIARVDRSTYYDWLENDEAFAQKVTLAQDEQIDFVEDKLMQNIEANDTKAIIYYLKTRGRKRGWNESIELTGKDGKDLYEGVSDEELEAKLSKLLSALKE